MIGKGLASCPQCSPMAQGGLVVMAGMVALVIAQSEKGGHQGKAWHQCAGIVWLSLMVGIMSTTSNKLSSRNNLKNGFDRYLLFMGLS